jgi:predicted RNase H-like HicB family nuclease
MVTAMSYTATVTREDNYWLATVKGLPGAHTEARTLSMLDTAVREVIVLAADLPDEAMGDLHVDYEFHTGEPVLDDQAAEVRCERHRLEQLEHAVTTHTEQVVRWAAEHGYSVRDTAVLTGVSPQRISQVRRDLQDA